MSRAVWAFIARPWGGLGLPVNGRKVRFTENVFYIFENARIARVWSIVDKLAIEAQL
ncbi:ester cyclase [Halomonas sp. IOP_31]|uniref:ester cyclase n=1 Tax=Halomonas sp. IOP_31 TaxID=2876584 RepID=UPI001E28C580|nr:ester cyclase [Halomonas sp. IOP_31]